MKRTETFEGHPSSNSQKKVQEFLNMFAGDTPELLSKLIELWGAEKEKWSGVAAMRLCRTNFIRYQQESADPRPPGACTVEEFANYLFSPNRYVPMGVNQGGPVATDFPQAPAPPDHPTILKVKIYMGSDWNLKKEDKKKAPNLVVKLNIEGRTEPMETKNVQRKTSIPCWNEEITLPLSSPNDAMLIFGVYERNSSKPNPACNKSSSKKDVLVGKTRRLVSDLRQGLHVIPLPDQTEISSGPSTSARNSAWLFVRLMFPAPLQAT